MRSPPPPRSSQKRPKSQARRRARPQDLGRELLADLLAMVSPAVRGIWRGFLLELGLDPRRLPPGPQGPAAVPAEAPDPYAVLQVTPRASRDVVEAAYRALAKRHHPDKGGDPWRMKVLNAAMDRIRKLRGWG